MPTCLDLFSGLGGFSAAFRDADGWDVVTVEIEGKFDPDIQADVMDLRPADLPDADVILASVPCVDLSLACMVQKWDSEAGRHPRYLPKSEAVVDSVALVYRTLWLIQAKAPRYWFLENPSTGMLRHLIGEPAGVVHYCQYGRDYKKPTGLWGIHPAIEYRRCPGRDKCGHTKNTDGDHGGPGNFEVAGSDSSERAKVPYELSASILESVERGYAETPERQATVDAF